MKYLPMISKCAIVVGIGLMVYNGVFIVAENSSRYTRDSEVLATAFGAMLVVAGFFGKK